MTPTQEAAMQQALEALEMHVPQYLKDRGYPPITALKAALAEPVQEQDVEDAIEAAYWHFDARKKGLNEWASAPQSERDAFKAEARKLAKGYFPTRQAQDTKREMLAVADAFIRGKRAALAEQRLTDMEQKMERSIESLKTALAEPEGGGNLPPPLPGDFDHAIGADRFKVVRGAFWWHVLIGDSPTEHGKFRSRASAEKMAADLLREFRNGAFVQHEAALAEPVQEPVAWRYQDARGNYRYRGYVQGFDKEYLLLKPVPLYAAPPQRKPLSAVDLRALYDQHAACQEEGPETSGWWDFARAIERAHGIV